MGTSTDMTIDADQVVKRLNEAITHQEANQLAQELKAQGIVSDIMEHDGDACHIHLADESVIEYNHDTDRYEVIKPAAGETGDQAHVDPRLAITVWKIQDSNRNEPGVWPALLDTLGDLLDDYTKQELDDEVARSLVRKLSKRQRRALMLLATVGLRSMGFDPIEAWQNALNNGNPLAGALLFIAMTVEGDTSRTRKPAQQTIDQFDTLDLMEILDIALASLAAYRLTGKDVRGLLDRDVTANLPISILSVTIKRAPEQE